MRDDVVQFVGDKGRCQGDGHWATLISGHIYGLTIGSGRRSGSTGGCRRRDGGGCAHEINTVANCRSNAPTPRIEHYIGQAINADIGAAVPRGHCGGITNAAVL